jgi:chemotaxis protein methyltransferase CheR
MGYMMTFNPGDAHDQEILQEYRAFLRDFIGLNIRDEDVNLIFSKLASRLRVLGLPDYESYLRIIQSDTAQGEAERVVLGYILTVTQTYFMRDPEQLAFLQQQILLPLIQTQGNSQTLKIWSAGCATGEEPYTIAMILDGMLKHQSPWTIQILATDINSQALEKAKDGIYPLSALKELSLEQRATYFSEYKKFWKFRDDLRQWITFRIENLVDAGLNQKIDRGILGGFDLIICRNVFIYFDYETMNKVLQSFHKALKSQGYLVMGRNELQGRELEGFTRIPGEEGRAYQKI